MKRTVEILTLDNIIAAEPESVTGALQILDESLTWIDQDKAALKKRIDELDLKRFPLLQEYNRLLEAKTIAEQRLFAVEKAEMQSATRFDPFATQQRTYNPAVPTSSVVAAQNDLNGIIEGFTSVDVKIDVMNKAIRDAQLQGDTLVLLAKAVIQRITRKAALLKGDMPLTTTTSSASTGSDVATTDA